MRSSVITAVAFAAGAFATPALHHYKRQDSCMTYSESVVVANNFKTLIANYTNAFADQVLCTSFMDYSDSVTELINDGCNGANGGVLGAATFKNRTDFEIGQGSQPAIPFEILNLWHGCNSVTIRWRTALTPQFVTGIIAIETVRATGGVEPWLIETVYSEFNSGAWLVDLGVFQPTCNATTTNTTSPAPTSTATSRRMKFKMF